MEGNVARSQDLDVVLRETSVHVELHELTLVSIRASALHHLCII